MRLALFALTAFVAPALLAQTPARQDTLPPLAPRDLEIRGELHVSLPSIERQPITAFGLAPSLRRLDPRRTPAVPAYVTPDIPGSALGAPVLPELISLDPGPPRRGTFEAGLGRAYARFAHAYFARPVAPGTNLFADVAYEGLSSFRPEGRPHTGADAGRLALGVRHARGTTALGATLDADVAAQGLYGAGPFNRRGGVTGGLRLDGSGYLPAVVGLRLGGNVRVSGGRFDPEDYESREAHLDAALSLERESGPAAGWLGAEVRVGSLNGAAETKQFTVSAGTGVTLQRGAASLRIGPRFLLADEARRRTAFTLDLDGRYPLAPGVALLLTNTPRVSGGRFADVFAESPFSAAQPEVRSEVVPVDARAGASFTQGTVAANAWLGYRRHTQGRFYEQPLGAGLVQTGYAALGEMAVGLTVRAMQLAGLHTLASVEVRDPVFTARGMDTLIVPHRARVEASLQAGYRLPRGKGLVQATLRGEGVRYADRAATARVAPSA
ncbi:MAG TPA: hypothetical protein VD948_11040, partial [Rhodothermales bacterium]|nr:hypothetical protein [Rhodothermales bacterium]